MTQILSDTKTDSPAELRATARLLMEAAALAETPSTDTNKKPLAFEVDAPKATPAVPGAGAIAIPAATDHVSSTGAGVPLPPPPPAAPGAEVDSTGVAWSAALHTSTKSKTIDGKWKPRKPRDGAPPPPPPAVPAATSAPAIPAPPPVPPPPSVMPPSASADDDIDVQSDTAGGTESVPTGATPGIDFPTLITRLTAGEVAQTRIKEVQEQFGLVSLFSLGAEQASKLQDVARAFGFIQ